MKRRDAWGFRAQGYQVTEILYKGDTMLQRCVVNGEAGWQWGNGKCHIGAGGQARAEAEGATEEIVSEGVAKVKAEGKASAAKVSAPQTTEPATVKAKAPAKKKTAKKK